MILTKVAVLILNYNSYSLCENAVDKLLILSKMLRILIVDNASTDDSYKILNEKYKCIENVQLVKTEQNLGYANGNNFGIRYIRQSYEEVKYVVVMNPDIIVNQLDTITVLCEFLEKNSEYAVVSCQAIYNQEWRGLYDDGWKYPSRKYLYWSGTFLGKLFTRDVNEHYSSKDLIDNTLVTNVDVVPGCFFVARLEDIEKVDYFDERTFLYFEENILSKKLSTINKKEAILLSQFFYHNHQIKDASLIDYKKRLFDRKCFHDSKMIYINYYSSLSGITLQLCKLINNIDFQIKNIVYNLLDFMK